MMDMHFRPFDPGASPARLISPWRRKDYAASDQNSGGMGLLEGLDVG